MTPAGCTDGHPDGQQALQGAKQQLSTTVGPSGSIWDQNPTAVNASIFAAGVPHPERHEIDFRLAVKDGAALPAFAIDDRIPNSLAVWCIQHRETVALSDTQSEFRKYIEVCEDSGLLRGEDGAFVNFEGVTRNNTKGRRTRYLEYECYEGMAVKMMAEIGRDIASKYDIGRIAIVHRLGRLEVSETSVAVVVTSPHRRAAFDAALEGINRLKKLVPVWKKEYFVDGEVWVEGEWDDSVAKARG